MKRLFSYILLCISILFAALVSFVPSVVSINTSADYDRGQEFIYKIDTKEESNKNEGDIENGSAIKEITEVFKTRLDAANISTYSLETEGNNTIKLSFKAASEINTFVANYLSFDWNMKAMDFAGSIILEGDDFFKAGDAYVDYTQTFPVIVIPLSNPEDFKTKLFENVSGTNNESGENSFGEMSVSTNEGEGTEEVGNEKYIYITNNWDVSSYSLGNVIADSESADTDETNAYFGRIDSSSASSLYFDYDPSAENPTYEKLKYTDFLNKSGSDLVVANKIAKIVCAQLNSTPLNYSLTLINKDYINQAANSALPFVESLILHNGKYGSYASVALSSLLIATVVAFVVVCVFSILNYGIAALSTVSCVPAVLLIVLTIFNSFGAEFNIGAVIGLIALAVIGLFTQLMYFRNIKEESYRGKNLKKAYQDTNKKTWKFQLDVSVITVLFGLVAYLIQNNVMISIGAILILGGLINIVVNIIFLRGISYFLYNSSLVGNKLKLINVSAKSVPNVQEDEKPTYFEPLKANLMSEKKHKVFKIVSLVLLIASVLGIGTFQIINGNIYNTNVNNPISSRAYIEFEYNENCDVKSVSDLETKVLTYIFDYDEKSNKTTDKNIEYTDISFYNYSYKENYLANKEIFKTSYYVIDLKKVMNDSDLVSVVVDGKSGFDREAIPFTDAVYHLLTTFNSVSDVKNVEVKAVKNVNSDVNNLYALILFGIGSALVTIYLACRYGLSKGLTSLFMVGGSAIVSVGIFSLIRGAFPSSITLGVILIAIFGYSLMAYFFNKEKELRHEEKIEKKDHSRDAEIKRYANNLATDGLFAIVLIIAILVISFLFTNTFSRFFIILTLIGMAGVCICARYFVSNVTLSLEKGFRKLGSRMEANREKRRAARDAKKPQKAQSKDDGPEEALFIGIND